MPTYDYECEACGHRFEQVQPMAAKPLKKCPSCGKNTLERLVTGGTGFILKGAGFWKNDSKSKKTGGVSSSATPAAESKSADGGGEAKPAAPAPASPEPAKPTADKKAESGDKKKSNNKDK